MKVLCPICLESFQHSDNLCAGLCGHVFHRGCLDRWLNSRSGCAYPQCRQRLPGCSIEKIVLEFAPDEECVALQKQLEKLQAEALAKANAQSETDKQPKEIKKLVEKLRQKVNQQTAELDAKIQEVERLRQQEQINQQEIKNLQMKLVAQPPIAVERTSPAESRQYADIKVDDMICWFVRRGSVAMRTSLKKKTVLLLRVDLGDRNARSAEIMEALSELNGDPHSQSIWRNRLRRRRPNMRQLVDDHLLICELHPRYQERRAAIDAQRSRNTAQPGTNLPTSPGSGSNRTAQKRKRNPIPASNKSPARKRIASTADNEVAPPAPIPLSARLSSAASEEMDSLETIANISIRVVRRRVVDLCEEADSVDGGQRGRRDLLLGQVRSVR